jgi:hypothetical protein
LNKRKVRLQKIKKLNFVKIQFNHNRSLVTHPEQFSCMWEEVQVLCFFRAEILPIKIIFICPNCTSKPHKYLIYNDMSLFLLVHGIMPHSTTIAMLNWNHSQSSVISIVYYSWKWFLNGAKFENITLTKRLRNFNIFPTVYHFLCSDKLFRSNCKKKCMQNWEIQKSKSPIFKTALKW